jgi:hypothetical protein
MLTWTLPWLKRVFILIVLFRIDPKVRFVQELALEPIVSAPGNGNLKSCCRNDTAWHGCHFHYFTSRRLIEKAFTSP